MGSRVKEQCPKCAAAGNDKHQDNLVRYEDNSAYCYACSYYELSNGHKGMTFSLPPIADFPTKGISSKNLTKKTCEKFNVVHLATLDDDGLPITIPTEGGAHKYKGSRRLGFPFYDIDNGQLIGMKGRGENKDFWMLPGTDKKKLTWFGINAIPANANTVVLTEGESDCMTVAQELPDVGALGAPGADTVERAIKGSLHVLKQYRKIVICFDNDEPGRRATDAAIALLPPGKTFVATLPADVKDLNDLLLKGRVDEIKTTIKNAKQVTPKGVVDADELRSRVLDYLFNRDAARGASTGFASLDRATGGAAPGKLITIAGGTGSGKSTFAEAIAVNAATISGTKTFFIPLEMTDSQVGARMVQQILREPIASDPYFKVNSIPRLDIERAIDIVQECIKFFDHFGSININSLVETCEYAIDAFGVQLIVLDHLTAAASGSEGLDWKALDAASSELKRLALRRGVCIIVVSHISRDGDNEDTVPQLRHLRGGNGIAQYSDCVLGVGRKRDSNLLNVRTIKVDRMVGKFVEFQLQYEQCALVEHGEVVEISPEIDDGNTREDGWDTFDEDGQVQVEVRDGSSDELPSATPVRGVQAELPELLHAGLPTTERDIRGDEGLLHAGGQSEDAESESIKPRNRLAAFIPADIIEGSE